MVKKSDSTVFFTAIILTLMFNCNIAFILSAYLAANKFPLYKCKDYINIFLDTSV